MRKPVDIIFFGDSIIACEELDKDKRWIEKIRHEFTSEHVRVIQKSYNGITSTDILNELDVLRVEISQSHKLFIVSIGINDSEYLQSLNGHPRVTLNQFSNNLQTIVEIIRNDFSGDCALLNGHKFHRRRLEGNNKTHNYSFKTYSECINNIAKEVDCSVINTYSYCLRSKPIEYCLPLPDGLHLSEKGSNLYFEPIHEFISDFLSQYSR